MPSDGGHEESPPPKKGAGSLAWEKATTTVKDCFTWRREAHVLWEAEIPHLRLVSSPGLFSLASRASLPPTWIDYVVEGPS
jgi:hypothetical protein